MVTCFQHRTNSNLLCSDWFSRRGERGEGRCGRERVKKEFGLCFLFLLAKKLWSFRRDVLASCLACRILHTGGEAIVVKLIQICICIILNTNSVLLSKKTLPFGNVCLFFFFFSSLHASFQSFLLGEPHLQHIDICDFIATKEQEHIQSFDKILFYTMDKTYDSGCCLRMLRKVHKKSMRQSAVIYSSASNVYVLQRRMHRNLHTLTDLSESTQYVVSY